MSRFALPVLSALVMVFLSLYLGHSSVDTLQWLLLGVILGVVAAVALSLHQRIDRLEAQIRRDLGE